MIGRSPSIMRTYANAMNDNDTAWRTFLSGRRGARGAQSGQLGGDEAVAHAGLGDEVAGMGAVGLELAAEVGEVDAEVVALGRRGRSPHVVEQLALGDELAGVANEHLEQLPLGRREADRLAGGVEDPLGAEVDREVGGGDDRSPRRPMAARRTAARSRASSSSIPNGLAT